MRIATPESHTVTWLLMMMGSHALWNDILCLESIKASLKDPHGYLESWSFNNKSELTICSFVGVSCWNNAEGKVLAIELSNMGLLGSFPTGIIHCTSLTKLDLSNNRLSGPIPAQIATFMPYVTRLDLSHNSFSGQLPTSIVNCSYLNALILNHNQLSGELPAQLSLLSRIRMFDVSHNLLSGPVPVLIGFSAETYADNQQLCGGPCILFNHKHSYADFRLGFEIAYALSFFAAFVCFSLTSPQIKAILSLLQKRRRIKKHNPLLHFPTANHIHEISQLEKLATRMSFKELFKATKGFSDMNAIGDGRAGTMYKATLPNGWLLAVKRFYESERFECKFVSEILALSKMRHDNLIPLLGFCIENKERVLVYKYMSNGSLSSLLHGEATRAVPWPIRVKIATGTARGLAWLHHKCIFRVVHRNINSASVLLDRFFEPKISNFGSSIISNDEGAMLVYGDESDSGVLLNNDAWELDFVKKDVYDYGMVLMELITGSPRTNVVDIDTHLIGQGFDGEISQLLRIASDCVSPLAHERPTMLKVYERVYKVAHKYGIHCDYALLLQPRRYNH